MRIINSLLALMLVAAVALGQNYYLDPTGGNDALDGRTEATAWKTTAVPNGKDPGFFKGGDSILLKRGETHAELSLFQQGPTNNGNALKIGAYGSGAAPIVTGTTSTGGLLAVNCGKLEVSDIEFSGGVAGITILNSGNPNGYGVHIHDCVVHGQAEVTGSGGTGISLCTGMSINHANPLTDWVVEDCTVYDCENDGISQLDGMTDVSWIIRNNLVHDIGTGDGAGSALASAGDGITGHNNTYGHRIYGNTIHTCRDGIHLVNFGTSSRTMEIYRNYVYDCTQSCISVENPNAAATSDGVVRKLNIFNNVCYQPDGANVTSVIAVGTQAISSPEDMYPVIANVVNNTLWSVPSTGAWYSIDFLSSQDALSIFRVNNNAVYSADASKAKHVQIDLGAGGLATVIMDGNRYVDDDATAFNDDGSESVFASFGREGPRSAIVASLGLVGTPSSSPSAARLANTSLLIGDGINRADIAPTDWKGTNRGVAWDVGAFQWEARSRTDVAVANKEVTGTANTLSRVHFSFPVSKITVQYSALAADAKVRFGSGNLEDLNNTWTGELHGRVVTFGATADFATLPIEVLIDPPSYTVQVMPSANITLHVTAHKNR